MFSEELKQGTLQEHRGLEKKLVKQIKEIRRIEDYVQLLERMYGYYEPLQQRIAVNFSSGQSRGRYAENIIDDIRHLDPGHDLEFEICENLPDLNSQAASMGALYVTEGSTLGGQIITGMIAKQLKIPTDKGFTFFNAYGEQTQISWENFKEELNMLSSPEEKQEILNSAKATFEKFNEWISLYE